MFYALFDQSGNRITTFVEGIHQNISKEAIEISEEEQNLYATNNYIRDIKTGKPIKRLDYVANVEGKFAIIRRQRNQLLFDSDKYMLPDYPVSKGEQSKWREYRQALRDLPATCNVDNPIWPVTPPN